MKDRRFIPTRRFPDAATTEPQVRANLHDSRATLRIAP